MITVRCSPTSMVVDGHAFFDQRGKDIVCAAVSAIVLGGLNAIDPKDLELSVDAEQGLVWADLLKDSHHNRLVLGVMATQLTAVAKEHKSHVRVQKEK